MPVVGHHCATLLTGVDLAGLLRDHRPDTPLAQHLSIDAGRIRLIGQDRVRTSPRPTGTDARNVNVGEDLGEHHTVVALAAAHDVDQRAPLPVHGPMNRGGQPTTRATDPMTCGFTPVRSEVLVIR